MIKRVTGLTGERKATIWFMFVTLCLLATKTPIVLIFELFMSQYFGMTPDDDYVGVLWLVWLVEWLVVLISAVSILVKPARKALVYILPFYFVLNLLLRVGADTMLGTDTMLGADSILGPDTTLRYIDMSLVGDIQYIFETIVLSLVLIIGSVIALRYSTDK